MLCTRSMLTAALDRLPTVSASQALQRLKASGPRAVPTSLPALDNLLLGNNSGVGSKDGGIAKRQVTEVYGPSGSGKTTLW